LLSNNVTGPGIAALPLVFVTAGWFPSLLLLAVLALTSGAAAILLCDAIRELPGNANYGRRVELLSAVEELLPRWTYVTAFATFVIRHVSPAPLCHLWYRPVGLALNTCLCARVTASNWRT